MKNIILIFSLSLSFVLNSYSQETIPPRQNISGKTYKADFSISAVPEIDAGVVFGKRFFAHCLSTIPRHFTKGFLSAPPNHILYGPGNDPFLFGAMEFDGAGNLYCISNGFGRPLRKLDTLTGVTDSLGYMTGIHGTNESINGMAYNPQNHTMYIMSFDQSLSYLGNIHSLNLDTRVATYIGNTQVILHDIAINNEGECYGIEAFDHLVKINLTNAETEIIGLTGVNCDSYIQSICFDRETDSLWFSVRNSANGMGELRKINIETGASTLVGAYVPQYPQLVGLSIPFTGMVSVNNIASEIPEHFLLEQNYPNPFNPETKINFSIPKSSNISIVVYDILGNEIEVLLKEFKKAGVYQTSFNGSNLPSGIYFYTLSTDEFTETKKMTLLK